MILRVGAFELTERLGKGGMAEVYRAVHVDEGVAVAVKIVTEPDIRQPLLHASLRNEVRAMARLDHPGIVRVFDYGEVGAAEQERSDGALVAKSPYLVMELSDGGTAQPLCGRLSWRRMKRMLVALLEALAHAHARGVLHRDVKPSNVLLCGDGVRLSDFGLAIELEPLADGRRARVLGTPAYMAPEQFAGDVRNYGPPTDLYGVGCLAYALACGAPPYGGGMDVGLMRDLHREADVPPLEPRMPVPEGFDAWLRLLLAKKPSRRPAFAADALAELCLLGDPARASEVPVEGDAPPSALSSSVVTTAADEISEIDPTTLRGGYAALESVAPPAPPLVFPSTWRRAEPVPLDRAATLGLYGVRPVPLVGREAERDRLWRELGAVVRQRQQRLVLLSGAAGCGKSRLAQWLSEHAHEAGAALVLKAVHSERGGPAHGLGAMVARYFRCEGLERPELVAHIERRLARLGVRDPDDAEAIAELVRPAAAAERRVRFRSATERHVLLARLLQRISRIRPVVMWLDDVDLELDTIAFAEHVMAGDARVPVLLLLTAASEALAERREEERRLAACLRHRGARALEILPLPEVEWPSLVERLLRLEPSLARRVAERTKGNPLFAVQLVGHWVDHGHLEVGRQGLRLKRGARVDLPDALHDMWAERIERLGEGRSAAEMMGLELAAVLGQEVDGSEWQSACAMTGIAVPHALVEELIARRLALADGRGPRLGWSFVHAMLCESLERRAAEAGRAAGYHRTCAQMLRARQGPGVAERLARHLNAAGEQRLALAPLHDAARERLDRGDYDLADALVAEREEALVMLRCEEADAGWAEGWLVRGELALKRGRFELGVKWATLAAQAASDHGWPVIEGEALALRGRIARMRGQSREADEDLGQAERLARAAGAGSLLAGTLQSLGRLHMHRGELGAARAAFEEARALYETLEDERGSGEARWSLAHLATYLERHDEALAHNEAALASLRRCGDRWGIARCLNTAGEIERIVGRLDEAERSYRAARDLMRAIGASDSAAVCDGNIARVLAERGEYAEARVRLERSLPIFEEQRRSNVLAWAQAVLLLCDAGQGEWASWDHHVRAMTELLADSGYLDLDIATVAEMAAELALATGQDARARAALELARAQWSGLGRNAEARRLEEALGGARGQASPPRRR